MGGKITMSDESVYYKAIDITFKHKGSFKHKGRDCKISMTLNTDNGMTISEWLRFSKAALNDELVFHSDEWYVFYFVAMDPYEKH
jgi:hypothetical protein